VGFLAFRLFGLAAFWPFGFFVEAKVITEVKDPCKRLWKGLFGPVGFFVEAKVITEVKNPCKRLWGGSKRR
jgi:hypothetical protein